ncbi:MAG: low-specificity L-threonine aldolase [Chloroflexota bacterium]
MSQPVYDLRSDTITQPTDAMRQAIFEAEVGDDVYGEDPTVNKLQEIVAEMTGKEAALFVSSGTQGNFVSVMAHCGRGDEMILGDRCHIFTSEQGGASALGSIHPRPVHTNPDGTLDLDEIEASIRGDNEHHPVTKLVCLENTHGYSGGRVVPIEHMDAAGDLAHSHGLQLHVDGARLWNAAVALGEPLARILKNVDTASLCLSKGLSAPVGSVVVGSKEFIHQARRNRKVAGSGMRQAGMIAAAGIVAVTEMVERLADDHENAKALATGLSKLDGIQVDPADVETNIVYYEVAHEEITPAQLSAALKAKGVLSNPSGGKRLRAVANRHIEADDIETILGIFKGVLAEGAKVEANGTYVYG